MAGPSEGRDRPAEEEQVPEGSRADEEDAHFPRRAGGGYGTSTRAVETLPRVSEARNITTWGPGPSSGPSAIS